MRILTWVATALTVAAAAVLVPVTGSAPASTAQAADLSYFDAGNIIADAVFFDSLATDAATVQAFLNTKGASCVAGEQPCLKDYRQTTATQSGDAYCSTYSGAANETAASIIVKVGQACGINPRVLVVLLQKEQGLVTGTRPATLRYTKATGFACPDTAACNPEFSGFASQVYFAARQFQRYAAGAAGSYRAGRNNTVLYNPSSSCGSSQVYIQNKATAGLYSYTPYQPNAAALAAGYGTGDSCSAYGNRNFWNYFTDWFGSTQSTGGGAIYTYYAAQGGASGPLGAPVRGFICGITGGGCFQSFTYGSVYWSAATGAHAVAGDVGASWSARGWETGTLGYPTTELFCGLTPAGCFQDFQGGSLYWSPSTGAHLVRNAIRSAWGANGWESGWLGYPVSDEVCGLRDAGCFNHFQGGSIYSSSAGGVHAVNTVIRDRWAAVGWENGPLGYPAADPVCGLAGGGCLQTFQGGRIYWSAASGGAYTNGVVQTAWEATGAQDGTLGYPVGDVACGLRNGGCAQPFQKGWLFWTAATGARRVSGSLGAGWFARGAQDGALAYPVGDMVCGLVGGGCIQDFQGGRMYWSPSSGAAYTNGVVQASWEATGTQDGPLGYPVGDVACGLRNGGCAQPFQNGWLFWTAATGAQRVLGDLGAGWFARGAQNGTLGYPVSALVCGLVNGGCIQDFQGGRLYWSAATGAQLVRGAILGAYEAQSSQDGTLGYPLNDETCGLPRGGCFNHFQGGSIYWTAAYGARAVTGAIRDTWAATGWERGTWGYPVGNRQVTASGATQRFENGTATWNSSTNQVTFG